MDIRIEPFEERYREKVGELIVSIQQREFGIAITYDQQPDLRDIAGFYQHEAGDFWLALSGERVVGSIALLDIGDRLGALRKMLAPPPICVSARHTSTMISISRGRSKRSCR